MLLHTNSIMLNSLTTARLAHNVLSNDKGLSKFLSLLDDPIILVKSVIALTWLFTWWIWIDKTRYVWPALIIGLEWLRARLHNWRVLFVRPVGWWSLVAVIKVILSFICEFLGIRLVVRYVCVIMLFGQGLYHQFVSFRAKVHLTLGWAHRAISFEIRIRSSNKVSSRNLTQIVDQTLM